MNVHNTSSHGAKCDMLKMINLCAKYIYDTVMSRQKEVTGLTKTNVKSLVNLTLRSKVKELSGS